MFISAKTLWVRSRFEEASPALKKDLFAVQEIADFDYESMLPVRSGFRKPKRRTLLISNGWVHLR